MTIEIDESSARVTKRGVTVWIHTGRSNFSITISKSSWRYLKQDCRTVHPKQIAFNQLVRP